ncbi:hypothetical protein EQG49_09965 [Periweissella cryptocerci]|uniref:Uncharacterized protein n=1 Tax=Periweissella cryptocerci TaxID=2506420 RepID=A0A4P6YVG6_9LACO|nr:aminoglycoside 6-adenylyltransferase [Periweissella cryptocerci]QBO36761.1 hypothetical protein EQG49_09965 [Periweissella cryptocerci]
MSKETVFENLKNFVTRDSRVRAIGTTTTAAVDLDVTLFVTQMSLFKNTDWLNFLGDYKFTETKLSQEDTEPAHLKMLFDDGTEVVLHIAPTFEKRFFVKNAHNQILADKDAAK